VLTFHLDSNIFCTESRSGFYQCKMIMLEGLVQNVAFFVVVTCTVCLHQIGTKTRACMTPPALKIWENGSIIKEIVQTCEWSC